MLAAAGPSSAAAVPRNKYRAKAVVTEDGRFASQAEYRRWCILKLMAKARQISALQRQVPFALKVNNIKVCAYVADATYMTRDGVLVVEDTKGVRTAVYRLKARLFAAINGYAITETR